VVTTESNDTWVVLAVLRERDERFACHRVVPERRMRGAVKQTLVPFLDLVDGVRIVAEPS
jgi:hypothetical protein